MSKPAIMMQRVVVPARSSLNDAFILPDLDYIDRHAVQHHVSVGGSESDESNNRIHGGQNQCLPHPDRLKTISLSSVDFAIILPLAS